MQHLDAYARHHGLYATLLLSVAAVALYLGRVVQTDELTFLFLPYNLVLGSTPVVLAVAADGVSRTRLRALSLPLILAWLVFLPNSVYLLTDLVHLRSREGIPHVYDSTMMGAFAGAGFLAGLSALSVVERLSQRHLGRALTASALTCTLWLNGLGVYIGRYLRWNSWDLVTDPTTIVLQVGQLMVQPSSRLWGITFTYTVVVGVCWLAFVSVRPQATEGARITDPRRPVSARCG